MTVILRVSSTHPTLLRFDFRSEFVSRNTYFLYWLLLKSWLVIVSNASFPVWVHIPEVLEITRSIFEKLRYSFFMNQLPFGMFGRLPVFQ